MIRSVFNIAILGMFPKTVSIFTYFIKSYANEKFRVSNELDADAFIIDFDRKSSVDYWSENSYSNKPTIILSSTDPGLAEHIWIKKPVKSGDMLSAINELLELMNKSNDLSSESNSCKAIEFKSNFIESSSDKLHVSNSPISDSDKVISIGYQGGFYDSKSPNLNLSKESIIENCGSRVDGDLRDPVFRKKVEYDPGISLLKPIQEAIILAREKNTHVEIQGVGVEHDFVIMPGGEKIFVELNSPFIRHYDLIRKMRSSTQNKELKIVVLSITDAESKARYMGNHQFMYRSHFVLWQVALWLSVGRYPEKILLDKPLVISEWPNFTRLTITPHAIAIASALKKGAVSPIELTQQMGIPQRYVFAFISAAESLGLINQEAVLNSQKAPPWEKPKEFFQSILRSLKSG